MEVHVIKFFLKCKQNDFASKYSVESNFNQQRKKLKFMNGSDDIFYQVAKMSYMLHCILLLTSVV